MLGASSAAPESDLKAGIGESSERSIFEVCREVRVRSASAAIEIVCHQHYSSVVFIDGGVRPSVGRSWIGRGQLISPENLGGNAVHFDRAVSRSLSHMWPEKQVSDTYKIGRRKPGEHN